MLTSLTLSRFYTTKNTQTKTRSVVRMDRYPDLTKFAFGDKWCACCFFFFFFIILFFFFDLGLFDKGRNRKLNLFLSLSLSSPLLRTNERTTPTPTPKTGASGSSPPSRSSSLLASPSPTPSPRRSLFKKSPRSSTPFRAGAAPRREGSGAGSSFLWLSTSAWSRSGPSTLCRPFR